MISPPWMPYKHPPGRRAQWVRIVPTTRNWPSGSATRRSMTRRPKLAGTRSSYGGWGTPGVSSGGRYEQCEHWRRWDGYQSLLPAGFGDVQSGQHLRRWHGRTRDWRSSQISRGRVMAEHNGRYTEWQSYRSPACYGWARQPPSGVEGPAAGDWGLTPSSVTHTSSGGGWGSYGRLWLRWLDREGSTSAVPLAHFCPQGSAYLQMVMATALRCTSSSPNTPVC